MPMQTINKFNLHRVDSHAHYVGPKPHTLHPAATYKQNNHSPSTRSSERQHSRTSTCLTSSATAATGSGVQDIKDTLHQTEGSNTMPPSIARMVGDLPIGEVMMDVLRGLDTSSSLVLQAPPGAGKTTSVPLALLAHGSSYLSQQKILVLEPRRVAAKAAARRMAALLGEQVGETVGYRVRLESRVSQTTRVEVITEGILLRMLQSDPELPGVGAILFDEFHERNLDADLSLALCLDLQAIARPDLRLLVMSATLGGGLAQRVATLMGRALDPGQGSQQTSSGGGGDGSQEQTSGNPLVPVVTSEGRSYPVKVVYLGPPARERQGLERAAAEAAVSALRSNPAGDVLVFLPGVAEIRRTERLLLSEVGSGVDVLQLHGSLPPEEQDRVVAPRKSRGPGAPRRIILATPIAESSLTIEGVRAVVDSGLRRSPFYDAATGVNRLLTVRCSQAAADQRAGRAGRTGPGSAYRLWSESDSLRASTPPEILEADLAPLALELASWGVDLVTPGAAQAALHWVDAPPDTRLADAVALLQDLGALDNKGGRITDSGRQMAGLGVHPRFAAMVLAASQPPFNAPELAAVLASLLSERDVLRGRRDAVRTASIAVRVAVLAEFVGGDPGHIAGATSAATSLGLTLPALADLADGEAARRVLLGAQGMVSQVKAGGEASGTNADSSVNRVVVMSEDEGEAGLEGDLESDQAKDGPAAQGNHDSRPGTSSSSSGVKSGEQQQGASSRQGRRRVAAAEAEHVFHEAWIGQAGREGLLGALVALAYPDRLAARMDRSNRRAAFTLAGGATVRLPHEDDPLAQSSELLAVAELSGAREGSGTNDSIALAAPLAMGAVETYLKGLVRERTVVFWASGSKSVLARQQRRLGALVLSEKAVPISDDQALGALMQGWKEMGGVRGLELSVDLEAWRQRVLWLRTQDMKGSTGDSSSLPDLSDDTLLATASSWLAPYLMGVRSKADMQRLDWGSILKGRVSREDQRRVDAEAPTHIVLPTGTRARIDYSRDPPAVACKIQEVFGLLETPHLAGGRVPLVIELLSPAQRPIQTTSDLARFWSSNYEAIRTVSEDARASLRNASPMRLLPARRELKGRYPKHFWPDDPSQAEPTKLSRKGMEAEQARKQQQQGAGGQEGAAKGGSKAGSSGGSSAKGGGKQQGGKRR